MEAARRDDRDNFKNEQAKSIIGSHNFNGVWRGHSVAWSGRARNALEAREQHGVLSRLSLPAPPRCNVGNWVADSGDVDSIEMHPHRPLHIGDVDVEWLWSNPCYGPKLRR